VLTSISDVKPEPPVAAQIERLRHYYEPLLERLYDNPMPRQRDMEQLEGIAQRYQQRADFISDLALDPPRSTAVRSQAIGGSGGVFESSRSLGGWPC